MPVEFFWIVFIGMHLFALGSAGHALLHKRDSRAALGWVAVILVMPLVGPLLYWLFGIARTDSKAVRLMQKAARRMACTFIDLHGKTLAKEPWGYLGCEKLSGEMQRLERPGWAITGRGLAGGNRITPLYNGEQAYPAMLEAIDKARKRVWLSSFIFDPDSVGILFIQALNRAAGRGCDVRLLTDGIGTFHPLTCWRKRLSGVKQASFLPPGLIPPQFSINLRTHRKVLVCDDEVAFTGGMNISARHLAETDNPTRVTDLHFSCRGPIARQLAAGFELDWRFVTEAHESLALFRDLTAPEEPCGDTPCRLVMDGPGTPDAVILELICAQISSARQSVRIINPYFLPPHQLAGALISAVLRGVSVDVILPGLNNHRLVDWAMQHQNALLAEGGVRIWYQPPPFAHTKLLLIDDLYVLFGSANLDPRSLNLNFELVVEAFDARLNADLSEYYARILRQSRPASRVSGALPVRLRNAAAWIASPYL